MKQELFNQEWIKHLRNETNKPDLVAHTYKVNVYLCKHNPGFTYIDTARPSFYNPKYAHDNGLTVETTIKKLKAAWDNRLFEKTGTIGASFVELSINEAFVLVKKKKQTSFEEYRKKAYIKVITDDEVKYYFINSMKIIDDENISYGLILDTVTTYFDKLSFSGTMKVKRKHSDRWIVDPQDPTNLIPNYNNPSLRKRENEINYNNFITKKAVPVNADTSGVTAATETMAWKKAGSGQPYYVVATMKPNVKAETFLSDFQDELYIGGIPWITLPVWPNSKALNEYLKKIVFYDENGKLTTPTTKLQLTPKNLLATLNKYASSTLYNFAAIRLPLFKDTEYAAPNITPSGTGDTLRLLDNEYAKTDYKKKGDAAYSYIGYIASTGTKKQFQAWTTWNRKSHSDYVTQTMPDYPRNFYVGKKFKATWEDGVTIEANLVDKPDPLHNLLEADFRGTDRLANMIIEISANTVKLTNGTQHGDIKLSYVSVETEINDLTDGFGKYITGDSWNGKIDLFYLDFNQKLDITNLRLDMKAWKVLEYKQETSQFKTIELRNITGKTFIIKREYLTGGFLTYDFKQLVSPDKYKKVLTINGGQYEIKKGDNSGTFILEETLTIPSLSNSYNDYFQRSLSQYNTAKASIDLNELQATVNGGLGIAGGVLGLAGSAAGAASGNPMSALGAAGSAIGLGRGISSLIFARKHADMSRRRMASQVEDLERSPTQINNNNLETFTNLENQKHMKIGNTGIVAISRELPEIEKEEVYNYFTKYGYADGRMHYFRSYEDFITRYKFSHWEIEDLHNTIDKNDIPPEALKEMSELFKTGVTLWNVEASGTIIFNDYYYENWEKDLALLLK